MTRAEHAVLLAYAGMQQIDVMTLCGMLAGSRGRAQPMIDAIDALGRGLSPEFML